MTETRPRSVENDDIGDGKTEQALNTVGESEKSSVSDEDANGTASSNGDVARRVYEEEIGHEQELNEKKEDVPPNGGYGWVCVACIATINAYVGVTYTTVKYPRQN
jgi:hypothetical protein